MVERVRGGIGCINFVGLGAVEWYRDLCGNNVYIIVCIYQVIIQHGQSCWRRDHQASDCWELICVCFDGVYEYKYGIMPLPISHHSGTIDSKGHASDRLL